MLGKLFAEERHLQLNVPNFQAALWKFTHAVVMAVKNFFYY